MIGQGATSLWENWQGTRYQPGGQLSQSGSSWNHIMYGSQGSFYYEHVAGIRLPRDGSGRGWRRIVLDPSVLRPLDHGGSTGATGPGSLSPVCAISGDAKLVSASARSATPLGFATIAWACDGLHGLTLNASVPVGATAQLFLPSNFGDHVTENGATVFHQGVFVHGVAGVAAGHASAPEAAYVLELLSGSYAFDVRRS